MVISREEFRKSHDCQFCGSQRCDASDEMMDLCWRFRELNLQGLCKTCIRAMWCPDAARFLDMMECNMYLQVLHK